MSFFSAAWKMLVGGIEKQGPHLTRITLPRRGEAAPIEARHHYFRIWLKDMRLSANNRWFTDLYPACHGLVAQHYGNEKIEITRIIGPVDLGEGIDARSLGRSILLNQPLTPLLPFNGGVVEMGAGLISIPVRNELQSFLGVVSAMSAGLNVPQVSAVLGQVEAVSSAITQFLGVSDPTVRLTYGESYTATGGGWRNRTSCSPACPTARWTPNASGSGRGASSWAMRPTVPLRWTGATTCCCMSNGWSSATTGHSSGKSAGISTRVSRR